MKSRLVFYRLKLITLKINCKIKNLKLKIGLIALLFFLLSNQVHASTFGISRPSNSLGLVGWWTMDGKDTPWTSSTAATTLDKSGNSNTGTLTNMAQATSPVAGKIGQALNFDGSDDWINAGSASVLDDMSALSISMWSKPLSYGQNNQGSFISKSNFSSSGWHFQKYSTNATVWFEPAYTTTNLSVMAANNTLS